jgi:hypothetical protein
MADLSDEDLTTIIATVTGDQSDLSGDARFEAMRAANAADRALNAPGDERAAFEAAIRRPPYERDPVRFPDDATRYSWPGNYRELDIDLAWCMWQARASLPQSPAPAVQTPAEWVAANVAGNPALMQAMVNHAEAASPAAQPSADSLRADAIEAMIRSGGGGIGFAHPAGWVSIVVTVHDLARARTGDPA